MKGTRHDGEQIIAILTRRSRIDDSRVMSAAQDQRAASILYYRWKAKYDSNKAKRLKQLEDENRKLKHIVELMLDNRALKDVLSKY